MKTILPIILCLAIFSCGGSSSDEDSGDSNTVTICLSEDAYAYHDHECMGLNKCNGGTEEISIEEAKDKRRTPCGFCY